MADTISNQVEKKIWDILNTEIGNPYGTAGLMGNLFAESSLNPFCITGLKAKETTGQLYTNDVDTLVIYKDEFTHDGIAYGLAQWRYYSRKEGLYNFAKANFMSIGSVELQCMYVLKEIKTYKTVWKTITTTKSVKEASDIVLERYEKPATVNDIVREKRASYGSKYFSKYAGIKVPAKQSEESKKMKKVITTAKRVFIRTGNGENYTKVLRIENEGTEFKWVATAENGWYAIIHPKKQDQIFWISGKYSKIIES